MEGKPGGMRERSSHMIGPARTSNGLASLYGRPRGCCGIHAGEPHSRPCGRLSRYLAGRVAVETNLQPPAAVATRYMRRPV
jgi:hypothetical protein